MATTTDVLPAVRQTKHDPLQLALAELERLREETLRLVAELEPAAR